MNASSEILSLFYLANALLILLCATLLAWLGPRLALLNWRTSRREAKSQAAPENVEPDNSFCFDYEDAVAQPPYVDASFLVTTTFPESADPITLNNSTEKEQVEVRRAYLKLMQCYNNSTVAKPLLATGVEDIGKKLDTVEMALEKLI
jgi:hypothetical protein